MNPISSYLMIFSEWLSQNTQMGNPVLEIQVVNKFSTQKESFQYLQAWKYKIQCSSKVLHHPARDYFFFHKDLFWSCW